MIEDLRPTENFKEMVSAAVRHQKVETGELIEFYLSSLPEGFIDARKMTAGPLAFTYMKAISDEGARGFLLKALGGVSLFTSGFFSDSLKRKIVDIDYYIDMGACSYGWLASLPREGQKTHRLEYLFAEL